MADLVRIREIFEAACDLPQHEREDYVHSRLPGDPQTAAEVLDLLKSMEETTGFLETPVSDVTGGFRSGITLKDRYTLEGQIGAGGFGAVFLAADQQLKGRKVVVKIFAQGSDDAALRRSFEREIETLAKINHAGIVTILDYGSTPTGKPFIVLQYVPGDSLRKLLEDSPALWEPARVSRLLSQLASALTAAHSLGVCHRDLTPNNIIVRNPGTPDETAVIIDFGIATLGTTEKKAATTHVAGAPAYMAPEQLLGRPTAASDQYSLGVVIFELLTHMRLHDFEIETEPHEVARHHLARIHPGLPPAARDVLCRSLHFDSRQRFPSVAEFAQAFAAALLPRRHWITWTLTTAGVAAIGLPAGYLLHLQRTPAPPQKELIWRWEREQSPAKSAPPDRFRIRVRSNHSGRLYLLNESGSEWSILATPVATEPGVWQSIPKAPDGWLWLDPTPPTQDYLWIVWSDTPHPDLQAIETFASQQYKGEIADPALRARIAKLLQASRKEGDTLLHSDHLVAIRASLSSLPATQSK